MKRLLFVCLVLAVAAGAQAQHSTGGCYRTSSGITCTDGSTFTLESGSALTADSGSTVTLDDVIMTGGAGAAAGTGAVAVERCLGGICQTVITLTALSVTMTDPTSAAAYGGTKIYDFPAGYVNRLGIVADLAITAGAGGISDTFDGDVSFGSTAAGATAGLHDPTTDDDWVLSTTTPQATGGVTTADCQLGVAQQTIADGHSTATDLNLNFEVDDADVTASDTLSVTGTVTVTWVNLGDN